MLDTGCGRLQAQALRGVVPDLFMGSVIMSSYNQARVQEETILSTLNRITR